MMKQLIACLFLSGALYACGGGDNKTAENGSGKTETVGKDLSANPDYQKGLSLIASSDCLTCHKVDEKIQGPAYRDVANKYPDNEATLDTLASKIIKGGSGNWGPISMTAHSKLTEDDAKQMVKYIMLLKTQ